MKISFVSDLKCLLSFSFRDPFKSVVRRYKHHLLQRFYIKLFLKR
ncbi:unnamed protein product [Brassica napus]|uniref:(rape) hypothetical protein n=1 Tax=Brassica napus TaxID=3708 RepID=A0A816VPW9_BRANA|nr:unnamed protein product [Brassica napus]